ncbi:MAG: hypothetical protein ACPL28_10760 [bacterium]
MKRLLNSAMIFVLIVPAFAARPFGTDDAGTVSPAGYELEIGYDFWKEMGAFGVGFKHGLTEKMDVGIGFGFNVLSEPKKSFMPSELCLKYAIVPDLFATSFTTEIGANAYNLNGIITRCFGALEVDANIGYGTADSTITYAGAIIYSMGNFTVGGEVSGDKENQDWLVGGRYTIREGLMIDVGFTGDFEFEEKLVTLGLHYEF